MNRLLVMHVMSIVVFALAIGCGNQERKDRGFFTSGSREADQRADQRMAKVEQLRGQGEGTGGGKTAQSAATRAPQGDAKKALYARPGGEGSGKASVDEFITRGVAGSRGELGGQS